MDFRSIIEERRNGLVHSRDAIRSLVAGTKGSVPDYQLSAWLMAAYLRPLSLNETAALTRAMADSGRRLDLSGLPRPWVDKHSTGGVGDKTTLVLLPLLASCGLTMVKMSGAGLGITGGTTDKLSSIPGFNLALSPELLVAQAKKIGLAISGQTSDLAPADKALYALRDATATVDSIPLIVSSILSKKLAGGAETVMLDVKCGRGGFMASRERADDLADWLERVSSLCGVKVKTEITDMDQPLGSAVGNALEVREAIRLVTNPGDTTNPSTARFRELCLSLASETLAACGKSANTEEGRRVAEEAFFSGGCAAKAAEWIGAQGGPATLSDTLNALPLAPNQKTVFVQETGWIADIDPERIGEAVLDLGGGRRQKDDDIDLRVGIELFAHVGTKVEEGQRLFAVHAKNRNDLEAAEGAIQSSIKISKTLIPECPLFPTEDS